MSYIITNNKHYKNIANAIRSKLRVETKYTPEEMASAIGNIPSSADGTNDPVAGIYFTDPDENRNVTAVKMVGLKRDSMPSVFDFNNVRNYVKKVEFVNCHFTNIPNIAFMSCSSLEEAPIPEGIVTIGESSFHTCGNLESLEFADSVKTIGVSAFRRCTNLRSINFKNIVKISAFSFDGCTRLTNIFFPKTLKDIDSQAFGSCNSLTNITLEDNFDCNNLNISASTKYTRETIVSWFNALKDRSGESLSYKLTIGQNLKKLTSEDIAIANNKNWTIV